MTLHVCAPPLSLKSVEQTHARFVSHMCDGPSLAEHHCFHTTVQVYIKLYITLYLLTFRRFLGMLLDLLEGTVIVYLVLECRPLIELIL